MKLRITQRSGSSISPRCLTADSPPRRRWLAFFATCLTLGLTATASAAGPPALLTVGSDHLHPTATFRAAGADFVSLDFSTSPARATNGDFLTENLARRDILTADEIQAGRWSDSSTLDPGHYWVTLDAIDFGCPDEPCVEGYSNMLEVTIPKPAQRYRGKIDVLRNIRIVYLTMLVSPLDGKQPYKVCWQTTKHRQRCVTGTVAGRSWSTAAGEFSDMVRVRLREMTRKTTFKWIVGGKTVATRTVATVPARS